MVEVAIGWLLNKLLPIFIVVFVCKCIQKLTRMEVPVETEEKREVGTSPAPSANVVKEVTLEDWCLLRLEGTIDEDAAKNADKDCTKCVTSNEDPAVSIVWDKDPVVSELNSVVSLPLNEGSAESLHSKEDTDPVTSIHLTENSADCPNLNEEPEESVTLSEVPAESLTLNEVPIESLTLNEVPIESLSLNKDTVETESGIETEINEDEASSVTEDNINIAADSMLRNTKMLKVYDVNGSTFIQESCGYNADVHTLLNFGLFKTNQPLDDDEADDESDEEDIISELDIQIETLPQGFIINCNVFLTYAQWHTMSLLGGDLFRCAVCQTYCNRAYCEDHTKLTSHVRNLGNYKPLKKFDLSIVRKINTSFHCGVCNIIFDVIDYRKHENSKSHEGNLLTAINKVSDLMFDSNVDKQTSYDSRSSGDTDRNYLSTNRYIYHMDRNMNSTNRNIVTPERDYASNFDGINVCECSDNEEEYTYEGEEYCPPSRGISYASMASKPRSIELPKLLKIDLGNREVRVQFDSWHMIDKLGLNKFYCMVCNMIDLIRFKTQHCVGCDHLEKLGRCTVVEEFQDYLIRKVSASLYHCGLCNKLQHHNQMYEHLETTHPKKNKNMIETANINSPLKTKKAKINSNVSNKNAKEPRVKSENEKNAIVTQNLEYTIEKKIDPNFDIFGKLTLSPFGVEIRISALAFNVIMQRDQEYYCAICNKICADVKVHVEDYDHMEIMNITPFIRPFKNNLTRAVRGTLHCAICNKLIPVGNIIAHNIDRSHTTGLAVAFGMVASETLDIAKKNSLTSNMNKPDNLNKSSELGKENGLNKVITGASSKLPLAAGVQKEPQLSLASTNQSGVKEDAQKRPFINFTQDKDTSLIDAFNKMATGENAARKFLGQNTSFPVQNASFPGQNASFLGQNAPLLGQSTPFPGQKAPLLGQIISFPSQNASFPGQNAYFPGQNAPFPGQNVLFPGMNASFPGQNIPFPSQIPSFPGQNVSLPGQNLSFLGQNVSFPAQNPSFPAQNPSFPDQNVSFPSQNGSFPGQNVSFPGQNVSFPGQNVSLLGQSVALSGQNVSLPGQNVSLLGQNVSLPGQNVSFPGQNVSLLGQNVSVPGQNVSFPGQNVTLPGQNVSLPGQNVTLPGQNASLPGQNVTLPDQNRIWNQHQVFPPMYAPLPYSLPLNSQFPEVDYTYFTATVTPYPYVQVHNQSNLTPNVPIKTRNQKVIEKKTVDKTTADALKILTKTSKKILKKNVTISTNNSGNLIKTIDDNIKSADYNIQSAEDNMNTADDHFKTADVNIETVDVNIETAEDNIQMAEDNIKIADDNIKIVDVNIQTAEDNTKTGDDNIETADDNIKIADVNIETAEDNIKTADVNIETAEDNIKTADDNIQTSEDNTKTGDDNIQTAEDNTKTRDNNIKTADDNIHTAKDDIKTADGNIHTAKYNIKTADDNVHTCKDNIKTADDNIRTAKDNIKTADDNIRTAQDNIKTSDGSIETVDDNEEAAKTDSVNTSIDEDEKEFDEEEVVYVKFKNMHTAYFKIDSLSYNTLVHIDNGMKHCFVCSSAVQKSALRKHVNSRMHIENVAKNKFLDKYGVQLFRQMYLMYHCAICNVLMTRKEIKMHLDWAEHIACYDAALEKRNKKNRKKLNSGIKTYVVETQKEAIFHNVNEPKIVVVSAYQIVPDLETKTETTEASPTQDSKPTVVKKKKMVILNNVVMKVSFDHWHGITCSKNVTNCIICQMEIKPKEIMDHVATEYHNVALGKTFEKTYYPALVRKINENTVNCMICNSELPNNEYVIHEHVNGRKHLKNQESSVKEASNSDSYTDCYEEYLNL